MGRVFDFQAAVPRDLLRNLAYRQMVRRACRKDADVRGAVLSACRHDILYFLNAFCWLFEPRVRVVDGVRQAKVIPFITWPHQEPVIVSCRENLGLCDIGVEKSRGEGASWIGTTLALHDWLFDDYSTVGVVSRNMDAADSPDDPDSLFWKMDWQLSMLPSFMGGEEKRHWKRDRTRHTLKNLRNGATIAAYPAIGDVGTGGRKKWFFMDELAKFPRGPDQEAMSSTEPVTDSRFIVSTPKGASGAYFDLMHAPGNMLKFKLHWQDNPVRNRGLYRYQLGRAIAVDPKGNPLSDDYRKMTNSVKKMFSDLRSRGYEIETGIRSPWLDIRCLRPGSTPQTIAQEYELDYGGSSYRIFNGQFAKMAAQGVAPPRLVGMMALNTETLTCEFEKAKLGTFKLWCGLDYQGNPPKSRYVVSSDVCTGSGGAHTSNSTIVVVDQVLGEQVGEYASSHISPRGLADLAIGVCRLFHGAYLVWEHNGPGNGFTSRVVEKGYSPAYERKVMYRRKGLSVGSRQLGWWTSASTKELMFSDLNSGVKTREIVIRSKDLAEETAHYIRKGKQIVYSKSLGDKDPNAMGENHGDRVIALAIAYQAMKDRKIPVAGDLNEEDRIHPGTIAWRDRYHRELQDRKETTWDDRGVLDFRGSSVDSLLDSQTGGF